jgi:hypothetical protein
MTKPSGYGRGGKCGGGARKVHVLIRGRSVQRAGWAAREVELRAIAKAMEEPPDPNAIQPARLVATLGAIGQKSAEGVVAQRPP